MIAKRVTRPKASSSFGRLSNYLLTEKTNAFSGASRLADYILADMDETGRVGTVRIANCNSDDPSLAVREILAVQAMNKRTQGDKTYHLVVSFPPGEKPTEHQLQDIETTLCGVIGFGRHQRLSAVHTDRAHLHLHIAINKIAPETFHAIEPYYDKRRLMKACAELELKHGLLRNDHGLRPERATKAKKPINPTDNVAFQQWVKTRVGEKAVAMLAQPCTWSDLHALFAGNGLELKRRGAGLVIQDRQGCGVRASSIDRALSLKGLSDRLGPFRSGNQDSPDTETKTGRISRHKAKTAKLYAGFVIEREAGIVARRRNQISFHEDKSRAFTAFREASRRTKRLNLTPFGKRVRTSELRLERNKRLGALVAEKRRLDRASAEAHAATWTQYLQRLAHNGNLDALQALRASKTPGAVQAAAFLSAPDGKTAKAVIFANLKPSVRRDGSLLYRFSDGGLVVDEALRIRIDKTSSQAVFAALTLGQQRFQGEPLQIGGTEAFKAKAVHIAVLFKMDIRFQDPEMENERVARLRQGPTTNADNGSAATPEKLLAYRLSPGYPLRDWRPADAGETIFRGVDKLDNGKDAILVERRGVLLRKAIGAEETTMIKNWLPGKIITLDRHGKLNGRGRR